jgi:hypothetical protein
MDAHDLMVLMRRFKGDANKVAFVHIFNQDALSEDDHAFLQEHADSLDALALVLWLSRGCTEPKRLVDRLVEVWPRDEGTGLVMFWLAPRAGAIDADAYDDLLERLRDRTELRLWWHLTKSLRGMCPTFERAQRTEHAPELVAALFPHRRDERACQREVLRLAREGGVVVRGPWWSMDSADGGTPAALRDKASVVAWMEASGMLPERAPEEVFPDVVTFPCEYQRHATKHSAEDYLLRLALRWPGKDLSAARDWYIGQVLRAARRGVDWTGLLYDMVGERRAQLRFPGEDPHVSGEQAIRLVDDIAWRSLDTDLAAPWTGYAVCRSLLRGDKDAWDRAFSFLERRELHFDNKDLEKTFPWARLVAAVHGNDDEMPGQPVPQWIPKWILLAAPLPEAPEETFDERLLSFAETVRGEGPVTPLEWTWRIAQLPPTRARANRLLTRLLATEGELTAVSTELLLRLAETADPLPPERLPSTEAFLGRYNNIDPSRVAAYRMLGGAEAEERLRAWIRAPLDGPVDDLGSSAWNAAARMRALPNLAPEGLRDEVIVRARQHRLDALIDLQKEFPELISEEMVREKAAASVDDLDYRWAAWDDVRLPAHLADFALRRCRAGIDARELVPLGRWLLKGGRDPREILGCVLDRSPRLPWDHPMPSLIDDILSSRSRWETFGPSIVAAMLADDAMGALWSLIRGATSNKDGASPHGIVVAIHEAVAVALLHYASRALDAHDEAAAVPSLHALVALHPPARLSKKLLPMIAKTQPGGEARDLVEMNLRLLRRSRTRDAQPSDLLGALQLLGEAKAA